MVSINTKIECCVIFYLKTLVNLFSLYIFELIIHNGHNFSVLLTTAILSRVIIVIVLLLSLSTTLFYYLCNNPILQAEQYGTALVGQEAVVGYSDAEEKGV